MEQLPKFPWEIPGGFLSFPLAPLLPCPAPGLAAVSRFPALPVVHSAANTAVAAAGSPWHVRPSIAAAEGGCDYNKGMEVDKDGE